MGLSTQQIGHLDVAESAFFARQLEQIRQKTYDLKLVQLKARMLVPVDNSVNPGAQAVTYRQFTPNGLAKIISSYADDLPRSDVQGKEFTAQIKSIGASYGYSIQEIRGAQMVGLPLDQRKANAARRAVEERIDLIAQKGDANTGLIGFLNQANALVYTIPNGAGLSQLWSSKTPSEILADMSAVPNNIVTTTKEVEQPDTMLLPLAQYGLIATTPMSPTNASNVTILEFFLRTNPYIKMVEPWYALTGAGAGGFDRMVVYRRDPDALMLVIPQEFEQFPPQQRGLEFLVPCHARCGGVQTPYPLSICYADHI